MLLTLQCQIVMVPASLFLTLPTAPEPFGRKNWKQAHSTVPCRTKTSVKLALNLSTTPLSGSQSPSYTRLPLSSSILTSFRLPFKLCISSTPLPCTAGNHQHSLSISFVEGKRHLLPSNYFHINNGNAACWQKSTSSSSSSIHHCCWHLFNNANPW